MAVTGWVLDKSAAARAGEPEVGSQLAQLAGTLFVCPVGELEQLTRRVRRATTTSEKAELHASFTIVPGPPDLLERALRLQRDLAHHHGMWHRTPIPDLLIAETAICHGLGVVHVDGDFDRIAEVRPLTTRRLG